MNSTRYLFKAALLSYSLEIKHGIAFFCYPFIKHPMLLHTAQRCYSCTAAPTYYLHPSGNAHSSELQHKADKYPVMNCYSPFFMDVNMICWGYLPSRQRSIGLAQMCLRETYEGDSFTVCSVCSQYVNKFRVIYLCSIYAQWLWLQRIRNQKTYFYKKLYWYEHKNMSQIWYIFLTTIIHAFV